MSRVILLLLILFQARASLAESCATHLGSASEITDQYISYLDMLYDERFINVENLSELMQKPLFNPVAQELGATSRLHARALRDFINSGELDPSAVQTWARAKAKDESLVAAERSQARAQTDDIHASIVMNRIGHIEVMKSVVTQRLWLQIMGKNPSFHKGDLDLPVENMTWYSALEFANRASLESDLIPVYKITGASEPGTNAEDGSLIGVLDQRGGRTLTVEEDNEANGYRLPMDFEMTHMMRAVLTDEVTKNPDHYFWSANNSAARTHAVESLLPLRIEGQEFFDVQGNVKVFTNSGMAAGASYEDRLHSRRDLEPSTYLPRGNTGERVNGIRLVRNVR